METHAQELHKTPGHGWKHYFFEFFMLFLAVFCGFLAENFREHMVDRRWEEQYMRSLKEDIQKDTAQIEQNLAAYNSKINSIDSISAHFDEIKNNKPTGKTMGLIFDVVGFPDFVYTDRTIQQLKNAGNMRLIKKINVADSITHYDAVVRRAFIHQDLLNSVLVNGLMVKMKYVFNLGLLENLRTETPDKEKLAEMMKEVLLVYDKTELNRLLNEYVFYKYALMTQYNNVQRIKKSAEGVLKVLDSEYNLK